MRRTTITIAVALMLALVPAVGLADDHAAEESGSPGWLVAGLSAEGLALAGIIGLVGYDLRLDQRFRAVHDEQWRLTDEALSSAEEQELADWCADQPARCNELERELDAIEAGDRLVHTGRLVVGGLALVGVGLLVTHQLLTAEPESTDNAADGEIGPAARPRALLLPALGPNQVGVTLALRF